jgi:hypothetical protein
MQINSTVVEFSRSMITKYLVVMAALTAMLVAAIAPVMTNSASAYERNQATAQANNCGNGEVQDGEGPPTTVPTDPRGAINVFCQNIGSQIQGDENGVALAGQQQVDNLMR